jgi:glycosyltransferase involved in cell wall biosynthesis
LRVLHIIKAKGIAGAEGHLLTLLPGLRVRDVDARLIVLAEPGDPGAAEMVSAAQERDIPAQSEPIYRDLNPGLTARLRGRIASHRPDIVHTHLLHADLYGIPAAKLARTRAILTTRHNDAPFRERLPLRTSNSVIWRMADAGIAISEAVRRFSIEVEGAPPDKLHTIHYGLPLKGAKYEDRAGARDALRQEIGATTEAPVAGIVARLTEQKGISDALTAFARIADRLPEAHLVIAGDGPLYDQLAHETARLGIATRTHFLGWRRDTAPLFAAFDMMLMPSLWEGFGITVLEAMAQATPIIATRVSALPEIVIPGENGLLVPPRDPNALAEAMVLLFEDKPLRMHMGMLGEDRLEAHFDAERMIAETVALYEAVL